jgi:hypothetical protein
MWDSFGAELVEDQLDSSLLLPYSSLDVQEVQQGRQLEVQKDGNIKIWGRDQAESFYTHSRQPGRFDSERT